ncbi:MAG: hypothetical protein GXO31_06960 [Epsilonproteobacteria bacterium]|nr:hypothetical protein [Campylobacterota bacterium]
MDLRELFSIIPPIRGVRVFEFSEDFDSSKELAKKAKEMEFDLEIAVVNEDDMNRFRELESEFVKVRYLDLSKNRYNQHSYLFDTVFINLNKDRIEKEGENFFKKIYRMMKNAGVIVYPVDESEREEKIEMLERLNYVAINDISFQKGICALTARKMHGWAKV